MVYDNIEVYDSIDFIKSKNNNEDETINSISI